MVLNEGVQKYQARIRSEKKEQILSAAAVMILEQGYDKTPVAEIAREAGVSLATFYKHFPSKPDILSAVCDYIITDLLDGFDEPVRERKAVDKTLKAIARRYADIITDERMRKLFRLIIAEVPYFPELGDIFYERIKEPVYSRLYAYIRAKADEGEIRIPDEAQAAAVIMSLINQHLMLGPLYTNTDPKDNDLDVDEIVGRAVDNFMKIYAG